MQIAIINNNQIIKIGHYRYLFPYTVFGDNGPTNEWLTENSCLKVKDTKEFNSATQNLISSLPYIEDGFVYTVRIENKSQEQMETDNSIKAINIRLQRNYILKETDWTQGKDIPDEVSTVWATYRQALRDIPNQQEFPTNVTWPVPPT